MIWKSPVYQFVIPNKQGSSSKRMYKQVLIDVTDSAPSFSEPKETLATVLDEVIKLAKNKPIIDFGAGKLRNTIYLLKKSKTVCPVEFKEMQKKTKQGREMYKEAEKYKSRLIKLTFPQEIKTVYLTDDKLHFLISIKNISGRTRFGKIPILCRYGIEFGNPSFIKIFNIKSLEPDRITGFGLDVPSKIEGNIMITIPSLGTMESLNDIADEVIESRAQHAPFEVICAFRLMDKGLWWEQNKREERLTKSIKDAIMQEIDNMIKTRMSEQGFKEAVAEEIVKQFDTKPLPEKKPHYLG